MGFLKRQNEILRKIEIEKQRLREKRVREFLEEIKKVSEKHKMILVPIISRYGPTFEVQELREKDLISEKENRILIENNKDKQRS